VELQPVNSNSIRISEMNKKHLSQNLPISQTKCPSWLLSLGSKLSLDPEPAPQPAAQPPSVSQPPPGSAPAVRSAAGTRHPRPSEGRSPAHPTGARCTTLPHVLQVIPFSRTIVQCGGFISQLYVMSGCILPARVLGLSHVIVCWVSASISSVKLREN
jgi:hypothetical protein